MGFLESIFKGLNFIFCCDYKGDDDDDDEEEFLLGRDGTDTFLEVGLQKSNQYRTQHGSNPLTLDSQLSKDCQKYAKTLAKADKMKHSEGEYGENLWTMRGDSVLQIPPSEFMERAVDAWYKEVHKYNFDNPGYQKGTGHFTALVWRNSEKVGMGFAINRKAKSVFVVGRYFPPGNFLDQFQENVSPKV